MKKMGTVSVRIQLVVFVTFSVSFNKSVKAGFHIIVTIAPTKVQRSLRSYGNHYSAIVAIVATTIAEIDLKFISFYERSYGNRQIRIAQLFL